MSDPILTLDDGNSVFNIFITKTSGLQTGVEDVSDKRRRGREREKIGRGVQAEFGWAGLVIRASLVGC
jgi:hypothetical protein